MKIIDAHIHFRPNDGGYFDEIAQKAGHQNTVQHLKQTFDTHNIMHAVVMGNREISPKAHQYPSFLSYCIGLDGTYYKQHGFEKAAQQIEENLKRPNCVGIKLYPGYCRLYLDDPVYTPVYELASKYCKPVAIHTGVTARSDALLKYSHPLTVDDVAVAFPQVQFIMCHFGNPWLADVAAVIGKNENVAADLSGLLEGQIDMKLFLKEQEGYLSHLKTWIRYLGCYDRFLYGTDWPLANVENYIAFVKQLIDEKYWDAVFFNNANRIYQLHL